MNKGTIVQLIGPIVDVEFTENLPAIYNALTVELMRENEHGQTDPRSAAAPRG